MTEIMATNFLCIKFISLEVLVWLSKLTKTAIDLAAIKLWAKENWQKLLLTLVQGRGLILQVLYAWSVDIYLMG